MIYALDTNIILDFFNKKAPVVMNFDDTAKKGIPMIIPSIVDYEVLRGFCHTPSPRKELVYSNLRTNCPVKDVTVAVWHLAASIWAKLCKTGLAIGDADILIAAICIANGYTLVTHNTKHFEKIDGLQIMDWL